MTDSMVCWVEHLSSNQEGIRKTAGELLMHPLALEDCLKRNQRAKFDDYETHQLLVWFVCFEDSIVELEFVLFPKTLVLVASAPAPEGRTWKDFLGVSDDAPDGQHLLFQALDGATDITEGHLRILFSNLTAFEDALFREKADPMMLLILKRKLAGIAHATGSLESVASQWQRCLNPSDDLRWRMRDLIDHCQRIHLGLTFHQTQIASTMDMYWGLTSKRTNDQIKKLSLIASVAVPLTVWSSFWGMNFQMIPFDQPWFLGVAVGLMIVSVIAVVWFFKSKGFWED